MILIYCNILTKAYFRSSFPQRTLFSIFPKVNSIRRYMGNRYKIPLFNQTLGKILNSNNSLFWHFYRVASSVGPATLSEPSYMFLKIGTLKNLAKLIGKHRLFLNKVTGLPACNFFKKNITPNRCFLWIFSKLLRTDFS